ncbi:MAG: hypothetical protein HC898_09760 [Phycisphaerales bacterium]|nr:hypothetical protein [Phycisphaerales bacterium]
MLRDHEHDWPDEAWLAKGKSDSKPVMRVWNKVDLMDDYTLPAGVLGISAQQGTGLETLAQKWWKPWGYPPAPMNSGPLPPSLADCFTAATGRD